jgi:riboflavin biosynthesis pyrimidine reductase
MSSTAIEVATAEDCREAIGRIYPEDSTGWLAATGVIHVASVWAGAPPDLPTLKIDPGTPGCATDAFVLALARARADAIVTTGKIVRAEPTLRHVDGAESPHAGLAHWRSEELHKRRPARTVVLTSRPDLDLEHPLFAGPERAWVMTAESVAESLAARAGGGAPIEIIPRQSPGIRDALTWLLALPGIETVLVEAGPATTAALYDSSHGVDELMLTFYHGATLPPAVRGGTFATRARLKETFPGLSFAGRRDGRDADWSFCRARRP